MRLYPSVKVKGQSFLNEKNVVIPNQSMSLQEIIRRFTRRESLPIEQQGYYEDRMGDLEKIAREDITERHERAEVLKATIAKAEKAKKKYDADLKAKAEKEKEDIEILKNAKKKGGGEPPSPEPPVPGA